MQAAMWMVFLASLGAAAFLANRPMRLMQLEANESTPIKDYRLPRGWVPTDEPTEGSSAVVHAIEPTDDGTGRSISIHVVALDRAMTPAQFLVRNRLPTGLVGPTERGNQLTMAEEIEMVGQTGLVTGGPQRVRTGDERTPGWIVNTQAYFATAVLPQRLAVMVSLQGTGTARHDDLDILRQVAQSIELKDPSHRRR